MDPSAATAPVRDDIVALREELSRLSERVARLEAATAARAPFPPPSAAAPPPPVQPLSEEILLVLSAAIAAFLGKKPHIRQIRLLGSAAWSQQGRLTIQASHDLATRHTRSPL
jgi:methylmalonyl-CoA carboxyltransferase large subunit